LDEGTPFVKADGQISYCLCSIYDSCTNGIGCLCSDSDAIGRVLQLRAGNLDRGRGFTLGSTTYALGYSCDSVGHVTTVNHPGGI